VTSPRPVPVAAPVPVAVTGAGVKTPAGNRAGELWENLCAGRPSAEVFEDARLPPGTAALVCRVRGFDPAGYLTPAEVRRLDRSHALAIGAAADALDQCAGLPEPARRAVVCGVGLGAASTYEEQTSGLLERGVRGVSPLTIPVVMPSSAAACLSLRFGFQGPCLTVSAACASGAAAIGEGVELLRRGAADVVLAGGVDSLVGYGAMCCFIRLDAMSRNVGCPGLASRPFDADRDGFVMGEGAGFVVLQRLEDIPASGPAPLGLILGHASTADAHHLVAPSPGGEGAVRCMELALADAGVQAGDIAHVNAHGTSTVLNDRAEAAALRTVFGDSGPPVMAVKGSTGHMVGGSGAVEAIVSLISLRDRLVPPVAGLRVLDPEIGLDVVRDAPRRSGPGYALSSSFGFGGANTALVLGAWESAG
jgi:3-oxoacyl-[acyl-carrier-protein] synthase II